VPVEQKYSIVDVFADEPLTGNPLAVVPDADGLSDARMRAIAREFNLSETTFLVRPADRATTPSAPGSGWPRPAGCARRPTRTPSRSAVTCSR
jgi:Phenazine biosynthesis-like protein